MFNDTVKHYIIAAISYVGGGVLLVACFIGIFTGKLELAEGIGFAACLSIAMTIAAYDANEYQHELIDNFDDNAFITHR